MSNQPALLAAEAKQLTYPPLWWSHKGDKMGVGPAEHRGLLIANGSVATLKIEPLGDTQLWQMSWTIKHDCGHVAGSVEMNLEELESAFRISKDENLSIDHFPPNASHAAIQGKFIRFGGYLNIPHPGTGRSGDPNISIFATNEIRDAVWRLTQSAFA